MSRGVSGGTHVEGSRAREPAKSSVLLDITPLSDETDMIKLEEAVRSVQMEGLVWGPSKAIPLGYGIKVLRIALTIVDDLVSVDDLIDKKLTVAPIDEYVRSCKIISFNKLSGKSFVLLDIKPWSDETDMIKLEEAVRSVQMEGLVWGRSKVVPLGYGIMMLRIKMAIVDDLVSVDNLIDEKLTVAPIDDYVQSCEIIGFNKLCPDMEGYDLLA